MNKRHLKVIICAGGTGGHIYPGISIAQCLRSKDKDNKILFFISSKPLDKEIVGRNGFRFSRIMSAGFARDISIGSIMSFLIFGLSFVQSCVKILGFRPDILVSMGGYSSLSSVMAAWLFRIPVIIHEQNVLPGAANRLASRFAKKIAVSFEESKKYFPDGKTAVTGNPVRESIVTAERAFSKKIFGFGDDRPTLLVIGGSQGAASINRAVAEMLPLLKDTELNILHVSGEKEHEKAKLSAAAEEHGKVNYRVFAYIDDMSTALSACDLVASRAGATVLAEIACRALPSVLVPYPYAAGKHQDLNAKVFESAGAAIMVQDYLLSGAKLSDIIKELAGDPGRLRSMGRAAGTLYKEGAAEKVAGLIYEAV